MDIQNRLVHFKTTNKKLGPLNVQFRVDVHRTWLDVVTDPNNRPVRIKLADRFKHKEVLRKEARLYVGRKVLEWDERLIDSMNRLRIGLRNDRVPINVSIRVAMPNRKLYREAREVLGQNVAAAHQAQRAHEAPRNGGIPAFDRSRAEIPMPPPAPPRFEEDAWHAHEELDMNHRPHDLRVNRDNVPNVEHEVPPQNGNDNYWHDMFPPSVESMAADDDDFRDQVMERLMDFSNLDCRYGLRGFLEFSNAQNKMRNTVKYPYLTAFLNKLFEGLQ